MELRTGARTDVGLVRGNNQDGYRSDHPLHAVADGMGGHRGGEIASDLALDVLSSWKDRLLDEDPQRLREAIQEANQTVFRHGQDDEGLAGMGTTLTAALFSDGNVTLAHVGDSRAYLLRGNTLSQLTEDQTLVAQWEREGKIDAGEAEHHPQRHILRQAVGSGADLDVDMTTVELRGGDRLLLATDGLHGVVGDDERIKETLLAHDDPETAAAELVELAKAAGGNDNITVLVLDVVADTAPGPATGDADEPVIVSKPSSGTRKAPGRLRRNPRRVALTAGAVALVALIGVIAFARSAGPAYLLGTSDGYVALLEGTPGEGGEPPDAEVVEVYRDVPLSDIAKPSREDLRSGIEVVSPREAERILAQLPRQLGPRDTPPPTPSPTPVRISVPEETPAP